MRPLVKLSLTQAEFAALYAVAQNGIASADDQDLEAIGLDGHGRRAARRAWGKLQKAVR
jgi:hypothetical protein